MSAFTDEQKAYFKELAYEVAEKVAQRMSDAFTAKMTLHEATCKTTKAVNRMYWMSVGFLAAGLAGGGWMGYAVAASKAIATGH